MMIATRLLPNLPTTIAPSATVLLPALRRHIPLGGLILNHDTVVVEPSLEHFGQKRALLFDKLSTRRDVVCAEKFIKQGAQVLLLLLCEVDIAKERATTDGSVDAILVLPGVHRRAQALAL